MLEKVCVNAKENEDFAKIVLSLMWDWSFEKSLNAS